MAIPQPLEGEPRSLWLDSVPTLDLAPAPPELKFDVLIVGGGIVGVSTAYMLREAGLAVGVVEALGLLGSVTGHTTGKLSAQHGPVYDQILKSGGEEIARSYAEANLWALRWGIETAEREGIECDLVRESSNLIAFDKENLRQLIDEQTAYQRLGLPGTMTSAVELPFAVAGALRMEGQARFHPLKFLFALVEKARAAGVEFYTYSRVKDIEEKATGCMIKTTNGPLYADRVVLATNYLILERGGLVAKLFPYRSYVMAAEVDGPMPDGHYLSVDDLKVSIRIQPHEGQDLLIFGGQDHKVGQEENTISCYQNLERWARDRYSVTRVRYRWSNQDNETPDKRPFIGWQPGSERILIATGFDKWGMTHGFVAGRIFADLITGQENPWLDVYDPGRSTLKAGLGTLVQENLNVAGKLIGDRVRPVESVTLDQLEVNQGAVVAIDGDRVACYRDESGHVHAVDPACTHMGCQVHFNNAERSWDCPCHGSRFGLDGQVLHGPAVEPLKTKLTSAQRKGDGPEVTGSPG